MTRIRNRVMERAQAKAAARSAVDAQLEADRAVLGVDWCEPYVAGERLVIMICGHRFRAAVIALEVALVDGERMVVVRTDDDRVWQQSYFGGWLLSWGGARGEYEPVPGLHWIVGRSCDCE